AIRGERHTMTMMSAARPVLDTHLIGGRTVAAHGTRRLERLDPATGQAGTALIPATAGEVTAAVRAAGDAAPGWRSQEPVARAAALRAAAAAVRAVADEL